MPRRLVFLWHALLWYLIPALASASFNLAPGFPWSYSVTGSETANALGVDVKGWVWVAGNVTNPVTGRDVLVQVYTITKTGGPVDVRTYKDTGGSVTESTSTQTDGIPFRVAVYDRENGDEGPPAMAVAAQVYTTTQPDVLFAFTTTGTGSADLTVWWVREVFESFGGGFIGAGFVEPPVHEELAGLGLDERAFAIAALNSGTPFCTGSVTADGVEHLFFVRRARLNQGGSPALFGDQVTATYWTGSAQSITGRGIAVDGAGNAWIVAESQGDLWLFKYTHESFPGTGPADLKAVLAPGFPKQITATAALDDPRALKRDSFGNLWVAGASDARDAIWKFSPDGTRLMGPLTFQGANSTLYAMVVDDQRRCFATGATWTGGRAELLFLGVDEQGTLLPGFPITVSVTEFTGSSLEGRGIDMNREGSIWVAGTVTSGPLDPWAGTYTKLFRYDETVERLEPRKAGNVLVRGPGGGVLNILKGETIDILAHPAQSGTVRVQVLTMRGELIREFTLSPPVVRQSVWRGSWDGRNAAGEQVASGVYAVRVTGGGLKAIKRVVVIRR